jgi:hypothetical protein
MNGDTSKDNTIFTSFNRNFKSRNDGSVKDNEFFTRNSNCYGSWDHDTILRVFLTAKDGSKI